MKVALEPRETPLPPRAAVARGSAAHALAHRVLRCPDEVLQQLGVVTSSDFLVVVAPAEHVPWVEGVAYLGAEIDAPLLLLPTTKRLSPHALLVERALRRHLELPTGALALLPWGQQVVSLRDAVSPSRERLRAWVERAS